MYCNLDRNGEETLRPHREGPTEWEGFRSTSVPVFAVSVRLSHVEPVLYRLHYEREFIVAIVQSVFIARECSPAVHASESHLDLVDAEVCQTVLFQVGRMPVVLALTVIQHLDAVFKLCCRD